MRRTNARVLAEAAYFMGLGRELRLVATRPRARAMHTALNAFQELVRRRFREKARTLHPDAGGSTEAMQRLVEARDVLLALRVVCKPDGPGARPEVVLSAGEWVELVEKRGS